MKKNEAKEISTEYRDGIDLSTIELENPLEEVKGKVKPSSVDQPIKVSISMGDLYYASHPVLAGHFENDGILFAELAVDNNLNRVLSYRYQLGTYPGKIGTSEVFITRQSAFQGAIIVGLGEPGSLTASQLTTTVEQGMINYLLKKWHYNLGQKTSPEPEFVGISSLIIGSGYGGLSVENSIKAIIQGVHNANIKVRTLKLKNAYLVDHIEFIELYEDKAVNTLFCISSIEKEENNPFKIIRDGKGIKSLLGFKKRLPTDEGETWWNRISVFEEEDENKQIKHLNFLTSTRSSREEEQELFTTPSLIEKLIKDISTSKQWTPLRAKAIFELLIPNDFKDQLKKHGNIVWVLDEYTASYPWELLQDSTIDAVPLCIGSGMIRQLKTSDNTRPARSIAKNNVLVVADPNLEGFHSQLPGALNEGKKVSEKLEKHLKGSGGEIKVSFQENHTVILEKLFSEDYKILHLSGHGVFNGDKPEKSGMVIGKEQFLSTREIKQMSNTPELVFVNCCHLGSTDGSAEELYQQRYKLAANIGTQLILNGVKCVIAAGWAVDDRAAEKFADVFYDCLLAGDTFAGSVQKARKAVYENYRHTNTWGAYQCYGDPFYRFRHAAFQQKSHEKKYLIGQQPEVELENLLNELEIGKEPSEAYLEKLAAISDAVREADIRNAKITELEALIYLELREYDMACKKFSLLMEMEDASFSFNVAEKYYNAKAKKIIEDFRKAPKESSRYNAEIDRVIMDLEVLLKISPTSERVNILGSSYKRKAFLADESEAKLKAYEMAAYYYQTAYAKFRKWYSLTNWLALESIFVLAGKRNWNDEITVESGAYKLPAPGEALKLLDLQSLSLSQQNLEVMDYWNMIATINIKLCAYMINFSESAAKDELDKIFADVRFLWEKAGTKGKRFAEIEHLEFIIDGLSAGKNPGTIKLRKNFMQMKDELMKLFI